MKLETKKPPKNREFLGLATGYTGTYWDIFFWATKEYGVDKAQFVDRQLYKMPELLGWIELPEVED